MKAEELKNFFNGHFFAAGQPKEVQISLTLETSDGQVCKIPAMGIWEGTTVGEIFHTYHTFLKAQPTVEETSSGDPEVERVVPIAYRDREYIVQFYTKGGPKIRKPDGEFLNMESPNAKAILKKATAPKE